MSTNSLREQVLSLSAMIPDQTWCLEDELRKSVPVPVQHAARQVILTGCGDSAIAARAAEHSFRSFTGLPSIAVDAMTASRYLLPLYGKQYPHTPLVFAVSNSGQVSRVVEAGQRTKGVGGYLVALTGDAASPLGSTADTCIDTSAPGSADGPGVCSYIMAALALNLYAIRIAEVRGRITMDEAQALRGELAGLGDKIAQLVEANDRTIIEVTEQWSTLNTFEFLGSGPARASAAFGSAKLLEATGQHSSDIDIEEWVHLNYFVQDPRSTATVLIAGEGDASFSRAVEVAALLTKLQRPWLCLGSVPSSPLSLKMPTGVRETFAPVVHAAALALLAGSLMERTGQEAGRAGQDAWSDSTDASSTTQSLIETAV